MKSRPVDDLLGHLRRGRKLPDTLGRPLAGWTIGYYHGPAVSTENIKHQEIAAEAEAALLDAAARLRDLVVRAAMGLRPFPAFMNMVSLQAIELQPPFRGLADRGCVVVLPNGQICQLDLRVIPGTPGLSDVDQIEEFLELDLPSDEYILYATEAIRVLTREMDRRR